MSRDYQDQSFAGFTLQAAVFDFHKKYGHLINYTPTGDIDPGIIQLRIRLIDEEVNHELIPALAAMEFAKREQDGGHLNGPSDEHLKQILDGAVDSVYVILGTLISLGLPFGPAFAEVQKSNMSKTVPEHVSDPTKKYTSKTPKGPDFVAPDLEMVIQRAKGARIDNSETVSNSSDSV